MSGPVAAGVWGRRVPAGGIPILASIDPSAAFRITMAALDPSAPAQTDEENQVLRATLKLIRVPTDFDDEDDEDDYDPEDIEAITARLREAGALPAEELESSEEDDSENEKNGGPSDPVKAKKAKKAALTKKMQQELEDEMEIDNSLTNGVNGKSKGKAKVTDDDDISDEDDDEDDDDEEPEEFVLCTLNPENHYQQPLDITVREGEEVYLCVNGTHDIYVTGNYIILPEQEDSEDDDEDDGLEQLGYDIGSDEDELEIDGMDEDESDELDDLEDPRITEVDSEEEEVPKLVATSKKANKKRPAESEDDATLDDLMSKANGDEKVSKKQAKKLKKNDGQAVAGAEPAKKADKADAPSSDKKKVQFAKNLELGPTGSPLTKVEAPKAEAKKEAAKGPRVVSGVTVEDKKEGKGKAAKKGDRVEMRYIGKLKNGKVFDSNKKGKPFAFKLGVGQVIKGWDVGVAGMTPGGERRLTIPAALAYGKKGAPPDIPANSDLIFDIKCISVG
ncbi:peptidylprolyl isomerase [Parastagonospora nodorum]|nr:peptidylprolyl isomerase [Parastagonospora nodorum]KAH4966983.1 peptidylprolyl isomerase [Parastagonospora nodorum]KAH5229712.1 peptidylprolyl isomerase [Parastagonospora nodorum]KAH5235207.1 peptidylprolyl isomerase [Parastagonospora nodorum]KAH5318814.1 peptidylprolyl isomerase [Parastagonospora nodorum]